MKSGASLDADPLVSILIPVYNGANYMRQAIDSALAQTYGNIEILVINDGSNDRFETQAIAKSYGEKIRYFEKPNGGVASALNLGIREMRGAFFSWLSHDDMYSPDKVEAQITEIKARGLSRRVVAYSDFITINENNDRLATTAYHAAYTHAHLERPAFVLLNRLVHGCALLISKDLFQNIGMFDESLRATQDYDLWNRLLKHSEIVYVPKPLVLSRQHEEQGSKLITSRNREEIILWNQIYDSVRLDDAEELYGSRKKYFNFAIGFIRENLRIPELYRDLHRIHESLEDIKISVIIPLRSSLQSLESLEKSVQSVLAQTHKNVEIIFLSTPDSMDLIKKIQADKKMSGVKLLEISDLQVESTLSFLANACDGDFVALLAAGEAVEPLRLQRQLRYMMGNSQIISSTIPKTFSSVMARRSKTEDLISAIIRGHDEVLFSVPVISKSSAFDWLEENIIEPLLSLRWRTVYAALKFKIFVRNFAIRYNLNFLFALKSRLAG